jgi:hypothetical protein
MIVPLILASSLVLFPIYVVIQRDLQLNGKKVIAHVVGYKQTLTKTEEAIHNYHVQFKVGVKTRRAWVDTGGHPFSKDTIEIVYAPLFPYRARVADHTADPWDQNLVIRSLAMVFISVASIIVSFGIYQRGIGRFRK